MVGSRCSNLLHGKDTDLYNDRSLNISRSRQMNLRKTTPRQKKRRERDSTGSGKQRRAGAKKTHRRYLPVGTLRFPSYCFRDNVKQKRPKLKQKSVQD